MKFPKLHIQSFLAITEAEIDLADRGLILIQGVNSVDTSATSNGAGKCLAPHTLISDAVTGQTLAVSEWFERFQRGQKLTVWGRDADLKMRPATVSDVFRTGTKPMMRVHLKSGSYEDISSTHPVATHRGMIQAQDLTQGDMVEVPRHMKSISKGALSPFTDDEVIVAAALMAEECLRSSSVYGFANQDPEIISAVDTSLRRSFNLKLVDAGGLTRRKGIQWRLAHLNENTDALNNRAVEICDDLGIKIGNWTANASRVRAGERGLSYESIAEIAIRHGSDELMEICDQMYPHETIRRLFDRWGLHGKLTKEKRLPADFFLMSDEQVEMFLCMFWACDGYVSATRSGRNGIEISVTLASQGLVQDISRLLLRVGIRTHTRKREIKGKYHAWSVVPVGRQSTFKILDVLKHMPLKAKRDRIAEIGVKLAVTEENNDLSVIPASVGGVAVLAAASRTGLAITDKNNGLFYSSAQLLKNGRSRRHIQLYADRFNCEVLNNIAQSDVDWEEFSHVENIGEMETFDITVDNETHLYALGSFITHNSTIADALCWCLFGVTARGASSDDVINKAAGKGTRVELTVVDDAMTYRIARHRKHKTGKNTLTVESDTGLKTEDLTKGTDKLTQEVVDRIIGCSLEVFTGAVYAGQERMPDLPAMTDRNLKSIIEEASGVLVLEAAYAKAREEMNAIKNDLQIAENSVLGLRQTWDMLIAQRQSTIDDASNWETARGARLDALKRQAAPAVSRVREARKKEAEFDRNALDEAVAECDAQIAGVSAEHTKLAALEGDLSAAINALSSGEKAAERAQSALDRAASDWNAVKNRIGQPCTECGRPLTAAELDAARDAAQKRVQDAKDALVDAVSARDSASDDIHRTQTARDTFKRSMTDLSAVQQRRTELTDRQRQHDAARSELADATRAAREIKTQIDAETGAVNPHHAAIDRIKAQIEIKEQEVETVETRVKLLAEKLAVEQEVVKVYGPQGVRAHILDEVTPFLNAQTSRYLDVLSDGNLKATWSTLSKDSKGNLKEKFVIDVTNDAGGQSFRTISGGEKRKTRIATALALQDLVATRASKPIDLFLGDEIDDALDPAGIERLTQVLADKARERGSVFVISHHDIKDFVPQVLTIEKTASGTVLTETLV